MDGSSQEKLSPSPPTREQMASGQLPEPQPASGADAAIPPVGIEPPPIVAQPQASPGGYVTPSVQALQRWEHGISARMRSPRTSGKWLWAAFAAGVLLIAAALVVAISQRGIPPGEATESLAADQQSDSAKPRESRKLVIRPIDDQTVPPDGRLELIVEAILSDNTRAAIRYSLLEGDELGAQIHPRTGRLVWIPSAVRAGGVYRLVVQAAEASPGGLSTTCTFNVRVLGHAADVDESASDMKTAGDMRAGGDIQQKHNWHSGEEPGSSRPEHLPQSAQLAQPAQLVRPKQLAHPSPQPTASSEHDGPPASLQPASPRPSASSAQDDPDAVGDQILVDLYKSKKLLQKSEYGTIRKVYADRFQRKHDDQIRRALGAKYEKIMAWLEENRLFKEELFTAIDPQHDDVAATMRIVAELIDKYPDKMLTYGELAIAVAVVWDQRRGVYDYSGHRSRAKALQSPAPELDAIGNFKYLLDAEKLMQGRAQYLPWEFLIHVVDHRTPEAERQWAVVNYLPRRAMIGTCYREVPYDYDLLDRNQPRLAGQQYTLPNIRTFGGVCAMQADFAARVAKSLGVPAAYVHGEAIQGDRHAWVMWVEVKAVSRDHIVFSLESYGRYRGDKYYVGHLHDPQTGQTITDRQLELRLHTVGSGPVAKRQAALVMRSYPMLREKLSLDVETQLAFLNQVITLCPGNEEAWRHAARLSKEGQITDSRQIKQIMQLIDRLFITFAAIPDFTWELFDDLVAFQKNRKQFLSYYERLVMLYQQAARPDLACQARLKYTDYLLEDGKQREAIEGLAYTIKKFPDEGRYVPRLLDRLEAICREFKGAEEHLVRLYQELLPLIPPERNGRPSKYFMSMLERAAARFTQYNRPELAQACQAQLVRLRAAEAQRKQPATQ